jgi:PII-like signaling protein
MSTTDMTVVRLYLHEGHAILNKVMQELQGNVRGVTVFRGIAGFGDHGALHTAALIDLSLDLPLVVEFFEESTKAAQLIEKLNGFEEVHHILSWSANVHG